MHSENSIIFAVFQRVSSINVGKKRIFIGLRDSFLLSIRSKRIIIRLAWDSVDFFFYSLSLSLIPPFWCYIRKKIAVIIGRKKGKKIIWFVVHDVLYRSFYTRFSPEILNRYNRHNKISKRFFSKVCECVWLLVFRYIRKTDTTADETDLRSQSRLVLNSHCSSKNTDWILCLRCVALCVSERVSELRSWSCRLPL